MSPSLFVITERHAVLTFIVTCIILPAINSVQFPAITPRYEWNCFLPLVNDVEFYHGCLRRLTLSRDEFLLYRNTYRETISCVHWVISSFRMDGEGIC